MKGNEVTSLNDDPLNVEEPERQENQQSLVRTTKTIVFREDAGSYLDPSIISSRFFNAFNHTLVIPEQSGQNITIGVTSAHPGEGKTIVAANMALSTALSTERDTVLVDLNPRYPRLHTAFGLDVRPGLADALVESSVCVARTKVKHLHVVTAGNVRKMGVLPEPSGKGKPVQEHAVRNSALMLLTNFRDVLYTLQQEFGFVIVDMAAANDPALPALFAQQMHGLLVVIDTNRTKREHIDHLMNRFGADRIRGFVLNRVPGA